MFRKKKDEANVGNNLAMEKGTEFNIKEGDRIVEKGTVTKIY